MTRLFLIGLMASGKSTLGKAYAREEGLSFIDLDGYIEQRWHRTIRQLFAERGEDGFRELERQMLHEVGEYEDVVIATGGGTPCFFDNMAYMNQQGITVCLEASTEVLVRRLSINHANRPMLDGMTAEAMHGFVTRQRGEREAWYRQARYTINGDELEHRIQIAHTVQLLKQTICNH